MVRRDGARCAIYHEPFKATDLQIDHRVPFEVSGDGPSQDADPANYMLVCASANRAKSWSCEHCKNWLELKDPDICARCYWAYPDSYEHVAMNEIRRLDIIWAGPETVEYDALTKKAKNAGKAIPEFVKDVLKRLPASLEKMPGS